MSWSTVQVSKSFPLLPLTTSLILLLRLFSSQPRKLRQLLDGLLASTKDMPSRMRQYSAFEFVQDTIRVHLKTNVIISELKSEALRDRHWRQLFKILKSSQGLSSLTLGQVYDLDLKKNEVLIKEVITQASGEVSRAFPSFLRFPGLSSRS